MKVDDYVKFTFEALAPLIEQLENRFSHMSYAPEAYSSEKIIFEVLDMLRPYKDLIEERRSQIEDAREGLKWLQGG